ncbi:MAG: hypothetical protein AB7F76_11975 [Parvibaculaceae bacterium]
MIAMRLIFSIPLVAIVLIIFAVMAMGSDFSPGTALFELALPSGGDLFLTVGDVFILAGLVALFLEVIKAARLGAASVIDHMLSTAAFIAALIGLLLVPSLGTTSFFLLTVMALIDVVAGFTISIFTARRDLNVTRDML